MSIQGEGRDDTEIRNPNVEIRNKFKIQRRNSKTNDAANEVVQLFLRVRFAFIVKFEFVSDFELRISDFRTVSRHGPETC